MQTTKRLETTSMSLHIMAMAFMLCDHLWVAIIPGNDWLNCIGRLAFPIFAFLLVEGYFHTHDLKKYLLRMLVFAILTEIPFNLVAGSRLFYPIHQNVLWTFLIALCMVHLNELARNHINPQMRLLAIPGTIILGSLLGLVGFVDYYHAGVLTVLTFYFFRGSSWKHRLLQLLALAYINIEILSGISYPFQLFGSTHFFPRQGFALLALIPIWLYRGKQGPYNRFLKYAYYGFYPAHLLILALLKLL